MSQQTQIPRTINAQQIARKIGRDNNGFPTLAQAFIDAIKGYDLTDVVAVHLYRKVNLYRMTVQSIQQTNTGSAWLLAS